MSCGVEHKATRWRAVLAIESNAMEAVGGGGHLHVYAKVCTVTPRTCFLLCMSCGVEQHMTLELSCIVLHALLSMVVGWTRSAFMALMYSVMQHRFGPWKERHGGALQPFWDGFKLGVKQPILLNFYCTTDLCGDACHGTLGL